MITFDTHPDRYKHWKLQVDGAIATLVLDVAEDADQCCQHSAPLVAEDGVKRHASVLR